MFIRGGKIYYSIRQQCGKLVVMHVANTKEMRLFVEWVEAYEAGLE